MRRLLEWMMGWMVADVVVDTLRPDPITPPDGLFDGLLEAISGFAGRLLNIPVPDGQTAAQAVLESVFGRSSVDPGGQSIGQALNPFSGDPGGLFERITRTAETESRETGWEQINQLPENIRSAILGPLTAVPPADQRASTDLPAGFVSTPARQFFGSNGNVNVQPATFELNTEAITASWESVGAVPHSVTQALNAWTPPATPEPSVVTPPTAANPATILPPQNRFESVVESLSSVASRVFGVERTEGRTATQSILERFFGESQQGGTFRIRDAVNPLGTQGPGGRALNQPGALGTAGRVSGRLMQSLGGTQFGQSLQRFASVIGGGTGGGAAGGFMLMAGIAGGAIAIGTFVIAIRSAVNALNRLGAAAWKTVNRIAKWNGVILASQLQLEVGRRIREIELGAEVEGQARERFRAQNRWEAAMHPFLALGTRIGLAWDTFKLNTAASIFEDPTKAVVGLSRMGIGSSQTTDELVDLYRELPGWVRTIAEGVNPGIAALETISGWLGGQSHGTANNDPLLLHNMLLNKHAPKQPLNQGGP